MAAAMVSCSPLKCKSPMGLQKALFLKELFLLHRSQWSCHASVDGLNSSPRCQHALVMAAEVVPHPAKVDKGGEDAFFMSSFNGGVLGVADGVSGWAEENVDPALFSREFVSHAAASIDEISDPKAILARAHSLTTSIGAATAIVAALSGQDSLLKIANLGDCGLRILRSGGVVFATSPQQHYFDCPFQLSSEADGQTANDAAVYDFRVETGDVIVMGSDGLFDNVYDRDIVSTARLFRERNQESAQKIAKALVALAHKNSRDAKYESPYSNEAIVQGYDVPLWKKLMGHKLTGGKPDDITVLVAHVVLHEISVEK